MSRTDAERSLRIYKTFVERTNEVIEYLSEAKALEHAMRLQIPNVKHVFTISAKLIKAPTGLTQALEDYLNDPDFETNRKQYIEGKEKGKPGASGSGNTGTSNSVSKSTETKPAQPGSSFFVVFLIVARPDPTNPFNALTGNARSSTANPTATQTPTIAKPNPLVDFFASIESEQTSMFPTPQQQQQQFSPNAQVYVDPT